MPRVTVPTFIDDHDGKPLQDGAYVAVPVTYKRKSYRLYLSQANSEKLDKVMEQWIKDDSEEVAGSVPNMSTRAAKAPKNDSDETPEQRAAIREWANANGFKAGDRGRISDTIRSAYRAAN